MMVVSAGCQTMLGIPGRGGAPRLLHALLHPHPLCRAPAFQEALLTPASGHDIPSAVHGPACQPGHYLDSGLNQGLGAPRVLTSWRTAPPSLPATWP